MADRLSPEMRSQVMSRIRGKDTTPERYVASLLSAAKLTYETHVKELPGRPDFVFREDKIIVFVDGDFWHGWRFPTWQHRLTDKWQEKISRTRKRDEAIRRKLRRMGWTVVRIWEHQIEADILRCIHRIADLVATHAIDWSAVEHAYQAMPPLKRRNRLPRP